MRGDENMKWLLIQTLKMTINFTKYILIVLPIFLLLMPKVWKHITK